MAVLAPRSARARAMARPMRLAAPVTSTVFPLSSLSIFEVREVRSVSGYCFGVVFETFGGCCGVVCGAGAGVTGLAAGVVGRAGSWTPGLLVAALPSLS